MPTPIDGKVGPSISLSLLNIFFPVADNHSLVNQVKNYMKKEREFYNKEKFDLVINDGDMGSNVLAKKRGIPSLFVTNQYMPKLWKSRSYLKPGLYFVSKQIAKATRVLVADSAPPHTICEYNLNFSDTIKDKVTYVGHFSNRKSVNSAPPTDLESLVDDTDFGYWMRTGNKPTNDGTGQRYEEVFHETEMKDERRIISHAKNDKSVDKVVGKDGKKYLQTAFSKGEEIGYKGKIKLEIEKLKWELKKKYTTLGKYVSDNKISKSVTDFSHDSNFLELANDVYKLKLYIEELEKGTKKK